MADSTTETVEVPKKTGDTVVIAVDGSEYSDYALQFYLENVHRSGNHVILAHSTEYKSVTKPAVAVMTGDPAMSKLKQEIEAENEESDELLEMLTKKMKNLQVESEPVKVHGEAGPAIVHLVHERHADFVVVGCRGKGTIRRTFTGSVTDYITHHSHVPVMIARHKDHIKHHGFHLNPFHHSHKHKHDDGKSHGHDNKNKHQDEKTH